MAVILPASSQVIRVTAENFDDLLAREGYTLGQEGPELPSTPFYRAARRSFRTTYNEWVRWNNLYVWGADISLVLNKTWVNDSLLSFEATNPPTSQVSAAGAIKVADFDLNRNNVPAGRYPSPAPYGPIPRELYTRTRMNYLGASFESRFSVFLRYTNRFVAIISTGLYGPEPFEYIPAPNETGVTETRYNFDGVDWVFISSTFRVTMDFGLIQSNIFQRNYFLPEQGAFFPAMLPYGTLFRNLFPGDQQQAQNITVSINGLRWPVVATINPLLLGPNIANQSDLVPDDYSLQVNWRILAERSA